MLSPAKINLGLEIHHRRIEDGYHYLSSLFVPISFGDEIRFERSDKHSLHTTNLLTGLAYARFEAVSERGDPRGNLLWRVLMTLEGQIPTGISIHLTKRVPAGAGLGGGSSNAGLLLRYLAGEFSLPESILFGTAIRCGSDIPFFIKERPMLVTGTGDRMEPIEIGDGFGILALSDLFVSTPEAYASLKRTLQTAPPPKTVSSLTNEVRRALRLSDWSAIGVLTNDFEEALFPVHPELRRIKEAFLENGAPYASMSGSGSAIFALVESEDRQKRVAGIMRETFPRSVFQLFRILK
jgi:4-diphosphocytidyl-2-C-methyl-D-erythritol kinase